MIGRERLPQPMDIAFDNPLITRLRHGGNFQEQDVRQLHDLCWDVRDVERGMTIVDEGERLDQIHLIMTGWAARYRLLPGGARQITALLLPGDIIGLNSSMLTRMDQGIRALTPVRVALLAPQTIKALESHHPTITTALTWFSMVEQATLRAWLVNMGCRHALERVANLLCELCERLSQAVVSGPGSRLLPLTQEEIADTLGLTPVHVNRMLQELRNRGMIFSRRGVLTVLDMLGLQQIAGFDRSYLYPQLVMPPTQSEKDVSEVLVLAQ